jgi:hypothetical protein
MFFTRSSVLPGKTFDANLIVCVTLSGDSSNESSGLGGFLEIKLHLIIAFFASFDLLPNLVILPSSLYLSS